MVSTSAAMSIAKISAPSLVEVEAVGLAHRLGLAVARVDDQLGDAAVAPVEELPRVDEDGVGIVLQGLAHGLVLDLAGGR